jgi:hypothetical protein
VVDKVMNVASLLVVATIITALTRPGSQGPALAGTIFSGFANAQSAALGGANYGRK